MSLYKLFCLHLARSIYETLTFEGPITRKVIAKIKAIKTRPIHPLLADEAKRLCDEAERSI